MSDRDSYLALRSDFKSFLKRFRDIKGGFPPQIKIKIAHTYRVVREITHLFRESGCKWVSVHTAQSAALLHDIGRFPQFSSFGTYDDRVTLNHAALSVVIIDQLGMLSSYNERDQKLIRLAVRLHSTGNLTTELPADEAELTHLLRDADKLDIWKFIIDRDKSSPVDDRFTESNFQLIRNFKRIPYSEAKTVADIRLFRIGWLFDVHFEETVNFSHVITCVKCLRSCPAPRNSSNSAMILNASFESESIRGLRQAVGPTG